MAKETANTQKEELDKLMFEFEEDPEMYATAGLPPLTPYMPTCNVVSSKPIDSEAAIKNVMSSISDIKGTNINTKVVVVTGNNTTMNFQYNCWLVHFMYL